VLVASDAIGNRYAAANAWNTKILAGAAGLLITPDPTSTAYTYGGGKDTPTSPLITAYTYGGGKDTPTSPLITAFADGGVFDRGTLAPMALFGEAGPEAIMPLGRDSSGRLGVRGSGGDLQELVSEIRGMRLDNAAIRQQLADLRAAVQQGAILTATETAKGVMMLRAGVDETTDQLRKNAA